VHVPLRLLAAARPSVPAALLIAIASSTAVFTATPFLLPVVSREFDVDISTVGWMSTAQLGGFVVASWVGGRFLRPVRSVFVIGTLIGVFANLASALAPTFPILAFTRFVSGLSLGLAAWIAWQAAFGDRSKTSDVAVVGPLVGMLVAPGIAAILQLTDLRWLFVILAVVTATPLTLLHQVPRHDRLRPHRTRHSATRAARVILFALATITMGGSSVFVYAAAIGEELDGLSPLTVSLVFSGNALASIPAAKWTGRRGPAGMWFAATGLSALLIATSRSGLVFSIALVGWGFVFFMGISSAFALLAARSRFPEERAGDAQAVMALGRVFGPLLGGALLAAGSTGTLGLVAGGVICAGAGLLLYVDRARFIVTPAPIRDVVSAHPSKHA
jgi:MFS transporter, DHA1 family, inner membrane transport protein